MRYKCDYCHVKCKIEVNDGANIPFVCPYRPETNEHGLRDEYTNPPWELDKDLPFKELDEGEVKKVLESWGRIDSNRHQLEFDMFELEQVAKAICKKFVVKDQWISVEDRLPENPEWFMVFHNGNREVVTMLFFDGVRTGNHFWVGQDGKDWKNITHWQPLPEPPKDILKVVE